MRNLLIYSTYIFSLDLIAKLTGFRHAILDVAERARYQEVQKYLVPEILNLKPVSHQPMAKDDSSKRE